ncbi:MAG: calcium-translocating P-type ATPase, PMCA-type [Firmicutes bacterium]|nr:calcium-translocating P-type ATPase, PMCA-type [Bacillota bacterium]
MDALYTMPPEKLADAVETDLKNGLTDKEARKRLKTNGRNVLKEKKRKSVLFMFFEQFNDFMVIILLAAAAVSFFTSLAGGEPDFSDPIIIMAILILNAAVGVIQEVKAERSLAALKKLAAPSANVIRNGKLKTIPAENLVRGDLLRLSAGDIVPADCQIISSNELFADESSLTGESQPAEKSAAECAETAIPLADRHNVLYSSTFITHGNAYAAVTGVGMNTEVGHIAELLMEEKDEKTPLQQKLSETGKTLGIAALVICAVIFVIGILKHLPPLEMFMTSVSLAVAAIPEGLTAIVTITLAIGVTRLSRHNAIVRRLPSVETLGSASVICSDKTGTITQNRMRAKYEYTSNTELLYKYAAICTENDTKNPTEIAILEKAAEMGIDCSEKSFIRAVPFDSAKKYMSVTIKSGKHYLTVMKGACDALLPRCGRITEDGAEKPFTALEKSRVKNEENKAAQSGLRVIAVAYRSDEAPPRAAGNMVFLGLIGFEDPPRAEAADAVEMCKRAGIIPVMITGDHIKTARNIAKRCGICSDKDMALSGAELDRMSDDELKNIIGQCRVFARVTPAHKSRIVKAWQSRGEVVAMTGDGVNDAPALKAADIGCSMGMSGTDVAKEASDIILTDDNFATIVLAVKEGRCIFKNIKKSVKFLLSSNIGEILTVLGGIVFGVAAPLPSGQLLWINLVTDSLPAIALGLDKCGDSIMEEPPERGGIFAGGLWRSIIFEGLMIGALALVAYSIGLCVAGSLTVGRTMAFAVLSISQLVHAFNMKSDGSVLGHIFSNRTLNLSLVIGVLLQVFVITAPFCAAPFGVTALNAAEWLVTAALSVMPLVIVELQKALNRFRK